MATDPFKYLDTFQSRSSSQPVQAEDPFEAELKRQRDDEVAYRIKVAKPDEEARARALAEPRGLAPSAIASNLPAFEAEARATRAKNIMSQYPAIGKWSAGPGNAGIAADDYDNLGILGKAFEGLKNTAYNIGGTLRAGASTALGGVYGLIGGIADNMAALTPSSAAERRAGIRSLPQIIADQSFAWQAEDQKAADRARPQVENWVVRNLLQGLESLPTTLAGVGVGIVAGPTAGASLVGSTVAGNEYVRARQKGLSRPQSSIYALSQGLIETATERLPIGHLVGDVVGKSPVLRTFWNQIKSEVPGEQLATVLQDLNEWSTLNPDKPFGDYLRERPEAAAATFLATVGGVGATTSITIAADRTARAASKIADRVTQARAARSDSAALDAIIDAAGGSKLRQRDPNAFADLVREMAGETGADNIYIPADAARQFMQSDGYDGAFDRWSDNIEEAYISGGDFVIPIETAVSELAGTKAWAAIKPDVRLSAGGMSIREAQTFDDAMADVMADLTDRMADADQAARTLGVPRDRLFQTIADKLMNAGFTPTSARQQAELLTQRAATRATRMGRDLTGSELDDLEVRQILPEGVAAAQKADQLDIAIDVMKRGLDATQNFGPSLMDFIAKGGGIVDTGGDLKAMGADAWHKGKPGKRKLLRDTSGDGQSSMLASGGLGVNEYGADAWAQRAWEAGYFPEFGQERPTANDLLDAISEGVAGRDRHLVAREQSVRDAAEQLRALLENRGIDPGTASRSAIRDAVASFSAEQEDGPGYYQREPVATLSGEEIAPLDASPVDLRKAARAWYNENLRGRVVVNPAIGEIEFSKAGMNKAISSSANPTKLRLFPALPTLIEQGRLVSEAPVSDQTAKPNVRRYLWLEGEVSLAGETHRVSVNLEERTDGRIYYNHTLPDQYYFQEEARSDDPSKAGGSDTEAGPLDSSGRSGPANRRSTPNIGGNSDGINLTLNAGGEHPRGRIIFPGGQGPRAIIELFQSRDQSTFLHETGHLWLEELREDAADPNAPQQVRDDWQLVQDWFASNGHPLEDGAVPVEAHELWARGVERYIMEGKAPSPGLRRMFQTFKAWLISLYNSVSRLRSPITDDIRGVMDRLIATDEELADAVAAQHLEALFPEKPANMSADEFAAYQALTSGAREAAQDRMLAKTMNAVKRRVTKEYRDREAEVRAEVTEHIDAMPEFRALGLLKEMPIDSQWVRDQFGDDATGLLPKQVPPVHKDDGASPDEVAELSGFASADDMVRTLMGVETRRREMRDAGDERSVRRAMIEQEVSQIMMDRYGDPFTDGSIQEEALAAVQSDQQGEVLAAELRVLARSTGDRVTPYRVAREWASRQVREGMVKDVASRSAIVRYERAASKAGRQAMEAVIAGDNAEAFRQKQAQMLNNALVAEARLAADEIDGAVSRLEKWAKRRTIKSVDQDYLERAQSLLEQVDMRPRSQRYLERRASFEAWAAQRQAEGYDVVVPPSFAESLGTTHWSRLTVEQMLGLDDAVKQIIHLGRLKQTLIDNNEQREFDAVVDEAVTGMNGMKQRPPSDMMEPSRWDDIKGKVAAFDASLLKMEQVFDWLDGGNSNGVFNRIVFRPLAEAQDRENAMLGDYHARLRAEFEKLDRKHLRRWSERFSAPELFNRETGQPFKMKREQLIAIALNMGNAGNIQRLTDGYGWREQSVRDVLNRELTPADWQFVQNVWDIIDTLWPQIAAMERRVNGVEPDKVEAQELQTPHGALRGGYYPAIYDTSKSYVAEGHAGKASDLLETIYTKANTRASSTRERSEQVKRPILLQIGVINRHLGEVIHDITHREAVIQADKFLKSERIMRAVDSTLGPEIRKQFRPWLKYVANSWAMERAGNEGVGKFMQKLRANTTIVGMGFRFTTMMTQIAGYSNSVEVVGGKWVAAGIAQTAAHPIDTFNFVMEKSGEVRSRMDTLDRDIRQTLQGMAGGKDAVARKTLTAAKEFAFHGIGYMDRVVVIPTWIGAYNKAQAAGMDEQASIYSADKAVRLSQGAGSPKDLAAVVRGTGQWGQALKLMTQFYSYMSAFYQRQRNLGRDIAGVRKVSDLPGVISRAWWLIVVPPLLSQILGGNGPGEDEDWGFWAFKQMLFQSLGPIPGVRDLSQPVWEAATGGRPLDYQFTPMQRAFQSVVETTRDARKIVQGDDAKRPVRHALETVGYLTGLVPGQIATSTQFLVDVANGEQDPETMKEWYRGLTKGKAKDDT
ncbi:LPD3 domain-containing protein [Sphingobium chungbukense]|uniref:LPD3 domain-containing protein n=1 Tax=Sphingobium chungbukense TaxID=56193 RepID=UPI000AE29D52|nr:acetyltransferase [Sphingobium chungbukense]